MPQPTQYTRRPYLIVHREDKTRKDVYGSIDDAVVVQAQLMRGEAPSKTALIAMHPIAAPLYLPIFPQLARQGYHVIACASRYSNGDAALEMENVVLDLAACVRDARERLGYEKIGLIGWSGGGSLMAGFQAEAENPIVKQTAAGEPTPLAQTRLLPADALVLVASHRSRHHLLTGQLDASILDEHDLEKRDTSLDLYDPQNPAQPPYTKEFVGRYRDAQIKRNRRITAWVKEKLEGLKKAGRDEEEFAFVVQGTMADPRWLDPLVDPNGRRPGWTYLGDPRIVNNSPIGLARYSSLRSWLSQWSIDDAQFDSVSAGSRIGVPSLVVTAGADDACPPSHATAMFEALGSADKQAHEIAGANHYFSGPDGKGQLQHAVGLISGWLAERGLTPG